MSTLKTTNLQHASAASPAIVLASDGTATAQLSSLNGGALSGARNRIINGDMRLDQRNAGASVTPADGAYTLDRWQYGATQASKVTLQQSTTAPAGFSNSLLITSSSAYSVSSGDLFRITQNIEGFNFADLSFGSASAKTVTLSFWVRSSLTGSFGGSLLNSARDRSYPFSYSISAANTWEYKTVTIAGDTTGTWVGSTNGTGVRLNFSLGAGSSNSGTAGVWGSGGFVSPSGQTSVVGTNGATFYITGVQLEAGTVATPFERRSYGQELALCQRYFYQIQGNTTSNTVLGNGFSNNANDLFAYMKFPVTMRSSPTVTSSGVAVTDYNSYTVSTTGVAAHSASTNGCNIQCTTSGGQTTYRPGVAQIGTSTSNYIALSAEL